MSFRFDDRTYYVDVDHTIDPYSVARSGGSAWLFSFGVYNPPGVLVYGDSLESGLEIAAEHPHAKGAHADEPDYKNAAEELGYDSDDLSSDEEDEVYEAAQADLTYTEAGWLVAYEWFVNEIAYGTDLYGDGVAAWVEENPDWVDDPEDEVCDVLESAGASEARIKKTISALRAHYGD
jgi:hypothetical protein